MRACGTTIELVKAASEGDMIISKGGGLDAGEEEEEKIMWRNAAKLLELA